MESVYLKVEDLGLVSQKLCGKKDIISVDELIYLLENKIDELERELEPDEEDVMEIIREKRLREME